MVHFFITEIEILNVFFNNYDVNLINFYSNLLSG